MKFLYLDSMDIANLGDRKWGDAALVELASVLTETNTRLFVSEYHLLEAACIENPKERFLSFLSFGIVPLLCTDDPRDIEIDQIYRMARTGSEVPASVHFIELNSDELDARLEEAATQYDESREVSRTIAMAEFFSIRANAKSHDIKIATTLGLIEQSLADFDAEAGRKAVLELELADHIDIRFHKRFADAAGETIEETVDKLRDALERAVSTPPEEVLQNLRGILEDYGVENSEVEGGMTWGEFLELVAVRGRAPDWEEGHFPRAFIPFLIANRIPYALESARRRDAERVSEAGDLLDGAHAMHLCLCNVMTADKRTVGWLNQSPNPRIRAAASGRLFRGGTLANLRAALDALRVAKDTAEQAPSEPEVGDESKER